MGPVITVGIPFYNNGATLEDAVRSVFAQTIQDWELILVDDGSFDNSLRLARAIRDPRVKVISDGSNRGAPVRHNQIADLAKGAFIAKMDGDDLMHPSRLEKQIRHLHEHPDVDLVDCAVYSISQHSIPEGKRGEGPIDSSPDAVLRHPPLIHAAVVGRSGWFRQNPYDPTFIRAHDHELWCRTYRSSRFSRIPEPLYFVREGRVSVSNYVMTSVYLRRIFRTYGPALAGPLITQKLILFSYLKDFSYRFFGVLKAQGWLVRLRNQKLTRSERLLAEGTISQIMGTFVPGYEEFEG